MCTACKSRQYRFPEMFVDRSEEREYNFTFKPKSEVVRLNKTTVRRIKS